MKISKARSYRNFDTVVNSAETGLDFTGQKSRVVQSQKDETDINVIVKRFGVTGQLPNNLRTPQYGDYEAVLDFQSAMQVVVSAKNQFEALPAAVRKRFGNDPQAYLEFATNPENKDELIKMGLVAKDAPVVESELDVLKEIRDEQRKGSGGADSASGNDSRSSGKGG